MNPLEHVPPAPNPYPNVTIAVAFVEETMMEPTPSDGTTLPGNSPWERVVALASEPADPRKVAGLIKQLLREIAAQPQKFPGAEIVVPVAIKQCDHPEFLQYLAGKLGLI